MTLLMSGKSLTIQKYSFLEGVSVPAFGLETKQAWRFVSSEYFLIVIHKQNSGLDLNWNPAITDVPTSTNITAAES